MLKENWWKISVTVAALIALVFALLSWFNTPKVAYVRSSVLVEQYLGMKEAKQLYQTKISGWQANIDTLESDYQRALNTYNTSTNLSSAQKKEMEEGLKRQQENLQRYVASLEEKAKEEDEKLTQSVLNQVNSYVKEYGEKHGHDVILGLTIHGNVLYGKESIDITDELIAELNAQYKGEKK